MATVVMGDTVILDDTDLFPDIFPVIDIIDLTKESPRIRPSRSQLGERRTEDVSVNLSTTEDSNYYYVCTSMTSLAQASENTQNTQMEGSITRMRRNTNVDEVPTIDNTTEEDNQYTVMSDSKTLISLICPICFEALSSNLKPTTTRCGHIFCAECLRTYFRTSKKCPTCKAAITLKSCTRLYF